VDHLRWVPIADDRAAALGVLNRAEARARAAGQGPEAEAIGRPRAQIAQGDSGGGVLTEATGAIRGLALWTTIRGLGRRVTTTYLDPEWQTAQGWTDLLASLLDAPSGDGPVVLLLAPMPGISEEEARRPLSPRGFRAWHRYGLQFPPGSPLPAEPTEPLIGWRIRTVGPSDLEALVQLNVAAYANSIDRFLFVEDIDPAVTSRHLLQSLFDGKHGDFLADQSFGLELDGRLLGATLVTRRPGYRLLADVEVHPSVRGQGHARRLIRATLEAARREPGDPVYLAVTEETPVALPLYRKLGFVTKDGPFTFWAHPGRLGLP
jgi:GNAT superfamily N-acetyltransferase